MEETMSEKQKNGKTGILQKINGLFKRMNTKTKITTLVAIGVLLVICVTLPFLLQASAQSSEPEEPITTPMPTINPTATNAPTITQTPEPEETHENEVISELTGEWIPKNFKNKRPYAIMFNNLKPADPQSGMGEAGIVYEALVEGGITRFLAFFDDLDKDSKCADRIGSVRSARHYYVSFADEYDAIFIHHGKTSYATKKKQALKIDAMDGTEGIGNTAFHQIDSIPSPHNTFTRVSEIEAGLAKTGIRTEHQEGYEKHFQFYEEDTELVSGQDVNRLDIKFSSYISPYFLYNEEDGLYSRYQFDQKHVDYNTGEILKFKNIIIQFVKEWDIDKNGYQTMDIEKAEGKGYYVTNGKMVPITWKKDESKRFMRYYDKNLQELTLNQGKTYIAVFPNHRTEQVVFSK